MTTNARFDQLQALTTELMQRFHVPGVALGVVDGDAEYTAGFGVTSVENPLPVTADTLFQVGSITKTVTATTAMRLVEQGKLDLDAPVRSYLPELRLASDEVAASVTLRHLFSHTGGWVGDYFDDTGAGIDALALIVERMNTLPQLTSLGTVWSYNNAGFYLAGRVLEVVSGQPYEELVREQVLQPLGMDTSFFFADEAILHRVVVGHAAVYGDGESKIAKPWGLARAANPVGGLISTVRDQLRYARLHIGDVSGVLAAQSLEAMRAPYASAAAGESLGIAWFVREANGVKIIRHNGATKGQQATLFIAPERRFAISMLTNSERGGELHPEVTQLALKLYLGVEAAPPAPREAEPAELEQYVGSYRAALADRILTVCDGGLMLEVIPKGGFPTPSTPAPETPPPMRMALCGTDQAIVLDAPMQGAIAEFLREPDGRIRWVRIGGRIHARDEG